MDSIKLNPCPKCGDKRPFVKMEKIIHIKSGTAMIYSASTGRDGMEQYRKRIEAWNRRS